MLPEAASVVFGGGFAPIATGLGRTAAQRSIYRVQLEFERVAIEDGRVAVALCDRGTIDGMAYWPGASADCLSELGTRHERELERYAAVVATLQSDERTERRREGTLTASASAASDLATSPTPVVKKRGPRRIGQTLHGT